ncbi:MAG: hypothetical protein KTR19_10645 [Hyphomicrobiales bacterium]|nr:hypothetical protein [Hyphomicrobiales bacterium]
MSKFFAWAATGVVTGLQVWPQEESERKSGRYRGSKSAVKNAASSRYNQRFYLRQRDGREIEILLIGAAMGVRNGHAITAVWAAQAKSPYGHCIYLENRTTGAIARLVDNLDYIRKRTAGWKVALTGLLVPLPLIAAIVMWLANRNPTGATTQAFFMSASLATILLLIIGFVSSKLFFDYVKAEDERQIWLAADRALSQARTLLIQRSRQQQRR